MPPHEPNYPPPLTKRITEEMNALNAAAFAMGQIVFILEKLSPKHRALILKSAAELLDAGEPNKFEQL